MDLVSMLLILQTLNPPLAEEVKRWDASGISTVYHTPQDRKTLQGGALSCLWGKKPNDLPDHYLFCAHRTYRCGTILHVYNPKTEKSAYCAVMDRGPFGALLEDGKWVIKIRRSDPGRWRGILDVSPGVQKLIGGTGWDRVKIKRVELPDLTR